jgi:8-oxo-dGTP pyrophosphatase MutT (NUDIX family)
MPDSITDASLDLASLRAKLRAHLEARTRSTVSRELGREAAVLVPLFAHGGEARVWLLRRPEEMRRHAGQVAFPGGVRDPTDASLRDTALREAEEEIGLPRGRTDVLGALDDLFTGTGFVITPYVAWLEDPFEPVPNLLEVARVFHAPLSSFRGKPRGLFPRIGYEVDGEFVWGATGAMVRNLMTLLAELA